MSRISNYNDSLNLNKPFRSGFKRIYSTKTAQLNVTDSLRREVNRGKASILSRLDLSAAFYFHILVQTPHFYWPLGYYSQLVPFLSFWLLSVCLSTLVVLTLNLPLFVMAFLRFQQLDLLASVFISFLLVCSLF